MYESHRLLRTKFLPLFVQRVVRLAHGKCEVVARVTFRRLMKDSRFSMKKARRSADTTSGFFQAQE